MVISDKNQILELVAKKKINANEAMALYTKLNNESTIKTLERELTKQNGWNDIAVIGMAVNLPEAKNIDEYWNNLADNKNCIKRIPDDRRDLFIKNHLESNCIKNGGFISGIKEFDPLFFNLSPKEAEYMDPRQRLFLKETWNAIEDSGYAPSDLSGKKCGVFVGIQQGEYSNRFIGEVNESIPTGNSLSVIPARISYLLNLTGPSIALDTACSSSLVALSLACDSINNGSSDIAISGGIQVMLSPWIYLSLGKFGMLNHDGKCKPFANDADGITLGEGVGVVVLKKYDKAIEDGDHIYGVIKGIGINQDGKTNGLTAPNGLSQTNLISDIYRKYNINPEDITYVEAHGTGTKIGDPIEVNALSKAFRQFTDAKQYCSINSVKGNIGHTLSASGIASVIKVLLSMKNNMIPATLNCSKENEMINFQETPFYVGINNQEWVKKDNNPRMAAISSFGMSGTNGHIVISDADDIKKVIKTNTNAKLLAMSAKSKTALSRKISDFIKYLKKEDSSLDDIAYTLLMGREHYKYRIAFSFSDIVDLRKSLLINLSKVNDSEIESFQVQQNESSSEIIQNENRLTEILSEVSREKGLTNRNNEILDELCSYYIRGYNIDFSKLFVGKMYNRISLPTYPYEQITCWRDNKQEVDKIIIESKSTSLLLQRKNSTMEGIKFNSTVRNHEERYINKTFYKTNVIGEGTLLEMAIKASEIASEKRITVIKDIRYNAPVTENELPAELCVALKGTNKEIDVTISYQKNDECINVFKACVKTGLEVISDEKIDIDQLSERCGNHKKADEFYSKLTKMGITYLPEFMCVEHMSSNFEEALVSIKSGYMELGSRDIVNMITEILSQSVNIIGLENKVLASLIYGIKEIKILSKTNEIKYLHIKCINREMKLYSAKAIDEAGTIVIDIKDFMLSQIDINEIEFDEKYVMMQKRWKKAEKWNIKKLKGTYIVLANKELTSLEIDVINKSFDRIILICGEVVSCDGDFNVDFKDEKACKLVIDQVKSNYGEISGIIDLSDIHLKELDKSRKEYGKLVIFQELIKAYMKCEFKIAHFTKETQTFGNGSKTIVGVDIAGFVRGFSREYRSIKSKTIDVDFGLVDIEKFINLAHFELTLENTDFEVCYRKDDRYVPYMEQIKESNTFVINTGNNITIDKERTYVITGGTRGIGFEIAKRLSRMGAEKIVLMGLTPFPPKNKWPEVLRSTNTSISEKKKIENVKELEAYGVKVKIFSGKLTDKRKLENFIRKVSLSMGPVGGVVHCAGSNLNKAPAFINKKISDMRDVFEPKIDAIEVLSDVFRNIKLDFFVLFSSIAAVDPCLSVGLSDYAAANYYLDMYSRYQFQKGHKYYKSLQWSSWSDVGMLVDSNFTLGKAYTDLGLTAHCLESGLAMFEDALSEENQPSIVLAIVDVERFNIDKFMNTDISQNPIVKDFDKIRVSLDNGKLKEISDLLVNVLMEELKIPNDKINDCIEFSEIGVDSIVLVGVIERLEEELKISIDPALFFEFATIGTLAVHILEIISSHLEVAQVRKKYKNIIDVEQRDKRELCDNISAKSKINEKNRDDSRIAVIGIGCNFPGAKNKSEFWKNLEKGISSIGEVPKSRWDINKIYSSDYEKGKSTGKWGGFIEGIESFDGKYFDFNENIQQISPLMRQYLEVTTNVIRDAGYNRKELSGKRIGVFVGTQPGSYPSWIEAFDKNTIVGIGQNFIASYASHFFNFKGPSYTVDSACSSSLLSIHLACQSIRTGESEMAIAGGVDLILDERPYMVFSASKALSPDGKCHTFDSKANGIVPGEGCGAILLKPLKDAEKDGDIIYCVIEGSAINNDGKTMGITTPNIVAQEDVIQQAIINAGIDPNSVGYIETHGTGTMIGDPIELKALTNVYKRYTDRKEFCGVGSVKTNIGHCLSAAGIAGFIKVALSIYNSILPPTLNCETPNKRFDFVNSPFYPVLTSKNWGLDGEKKRAGISSFGFGGTNVHMILGERENIADYRIKRASIEPEKFIKEWHWAKNEKCEVEDKSNFNSLEFVIEE